MENTLMKNLKEVESQVNEDPKAISIHGLAEASAAYPLFDAETNLDWLNRNVEIMEFMFRQWNEGEIDGDKLSVIMYEGFEKLHAFIDEIEESVKTAKGRK